MLEILTFVGTLLNHLNTFVKLILSLFFFSWSSVIFNETDQFENPVKKLLTGPQKGLLGALGLSKTLLRPTATQLSTPKSPYHNIHKFIILFVSSCVGQLLE